MKRLHILIPILGAAAISLGLTGCGDSGPTCGAGTMEVAGMCVPDVTCGDGTHAEGGQCVADSQCGTGTKEDPGTGQCVPDGSVICPQGTTFQDGQCKLDENACAEGTVLVNGQCVPEDDTLTADANEAAEPNDDPASPAGTIAVGAVDSSTVIHGCINPRADEDGDGNLDADFDVWVVNATAPVTLEITADGVHGLVAGFVMINGDAQLSPELDNWRRFGINLTSDTAKRQVYLPAAGSYLLLMTDARSLVLGSAGAGDADACYYTTVKRVPTPAPVALTLPQTMASDNGQVKLYTFTAPSEGRVLTISQNSDSSVMFPAFLVLRGAQNDLAASLRDTGSFYGVGALAMGETVTIVSDMEYDWALTPQDYTYDLVDINAQPLPADGSVTLTKRNGLTPDSPYADWNYLYFDVAGTGTIVNFTVTGGTTATPPVALPLDMAITRQDVFNAGDVISIIDGFGGTGRTGGFNNEFVRFDRPGRYYFIVQDPTGTSGDMFTVTSRFATAPTTAVTYGTPLANQALPMNGNAFHTLDLTNPIWVEAGVTGTSFPSGTTGAELDFYDLAGFGWMSTVGGTGSANYAAVFARQINADGSVPIGRIMAHDTRDYLVRVRANGTAGANPTYTLDIKNRDAFNFQTIMAGTPINRAGMDLVPAATGTSQSSFGKKRFIVFGGNGNMLTALVTPTNALADIQIQRLNADESNNGSAVNGGAVGAAETLRNTAFRASPDDWIAFEVQNRTQAQSTNINMTLTAAPPPYSVADGNIPWSNACNGAGSTTLGTDQDDEILAARSLPAGFNFRFFGAPMTKYIVAANGFLTLGGDTLAPPNCAFDGCWFNDPLPGAADPNGVVAPFWDDLQHATICVKEEATTITVQWVGVRWGTTNTVAFQAILNMNGTINLLYDGAPFHAADGSTATIGVENAAGTDAVQLSFNTASMLAGRARVLTPTM